MMLRLMLSVLLCTLLVQPAAADDALAIHGKALAEKNCVTCHALGAVGASPLRDAPTFRDIAANYDAGELEDAFNDGVVTQHPAMPDWQMTPEQAAALATYIMSLAPHGIKKTEALQN